MSDLDQWQRFVSEGLAPETHVFFTDSWQRSRELGVDPHAARIGQPKDSSPRNKEETEFLNYLSGIIEPDLHGSQKLRLAWAVLDPDAVVYRLLCSHATFAKELGALGIAPKVQLNLKSSGTNAISLAHDLGRRCMTTGYQHWAACLHKLILFCCPLFEIDGQLMGYAALLGDKDEVSSAHGHSCMQFLALAVDTRTRLKRSSNTHNTLRGLVSLFFSEDANPTIWVNPKGYLRMINPAALDMLKLSAEDVGKQKRVDNLASFRPAIREIAACAIVEDIPMQIHTQNRRMQISCLRTPLHGERDEFLGVSLCFRQETLREKALANHELRARYTFDDIVGNTPSLKRACMLARQVAASQISVLLIGESGTGKEIFAQSIHSAGGLSSGPSVSVNCAAIPADIAESELFGYGKGAFTGALKEGRKGLLETASGGTLFLDEIGDMPPLLQAKLLRVLETRSLTRVGETQPLPVTFRVIAATNRDLQQEVEDKNFREDLYYRLAVSVIRLPSLAEAREDIPELFTGFIESYSEQMGKKITEYKPGVLEALKSYPWRGNIRELRNAAEFTVMMNSGNEPVSVKHLPGEMRMGILYSKSEENLSPHAPDPLLVERKNVEHSEKALIEKALEMSGGHADNAARFMGISRATFYRKLKMHELKLRAWKRAAPPPFPR
ncbi:MAG: sigma 54-interacting transcriptional regulator [Planctomycetes bacterium]|nr:sigma 54-interacting transcriptional regulator [Planctomycetota bacterium]